MLFRKKNKSQLLDLIDYAEEQVKRARLNMNLARLNFNASHEMLKAHEQYLCELKSKLKEVEIGG